MSPTPAPEVAASVYQVWLPFIGGLVGALIGPPFLEFLKDRISSSRAWKKQEHEITSTLRYVLGVLNGFYELRLVAFGTSKNNFRFSAPAASALSGYALAPVLEKAYQLVFVHPSASDKQVLGQYLSKHLSLMHAQCQSIVQLHASLQEFQDYPRLELQDDERRTLAEFDAQYRYFQIFLYHVYAKEMGLGSPGSLIGLDRVRKLEQQVLLSDLLNAHKEIDDVLSASQKLFGDKGTP